MKQTIIILSIFFSSCAFAKQLDWHKLDEPTQAKPKVYGGYSAGCVDGAVMLPKYGKGFKRSTYENGRNFGHPNLVNMLLDLGQTVESEYGKELLIGDLGHARGGPASIKSSAHRSHQNGLDVDIWYNYHDVGSTKKPKAVSMLKRNKKGLGKNWHDINAKILHDIAQFDDVERILVNPYIKQEMCEKYDNAKWLQKFRPWWGHHKHFHVRLRCPEGSDDCKPQGETPNESGCGETLAWWFSDEAGQMGKKKDAQKRVYPNLPKQCDAVFKAEG
jgi:penicillin-insensitive murein endopeptidase